MEKSYVIKSQRGKIQYFKANFVDSSVKMLNKVNDSTDNLNKLCCDIISCEFFSYAKL